MFYSKSTEETYSVSYSGGEEKVVLDDPGSIPPSAWGSLATWAHLYTPSEPLPAKVSERGLKAIIRPRSSCALVTGPLSGKLRSPDLSSPAEMPRCAVLGTSPANSLGHS